ncbi:AGC family protein kinase [Tritrichomonas foetus]|uniref:non-specific serine/threonine protein kinase n=1 Tax=Tritrichomonas foetus TaxID=1144522 RepID=A0A1J4J8L0_9EUKA|nr:AGC family protein kinase [Tritrichomonas foetus]|eukprot:OHS95518.1 AGC family protein kinase [Tritrichomonas foetus]
MSVIRRPAQLSYNIPPKQYSRNVFEPDQNMLLRAQAVQNCLQENWKKTIVDNQANNNDIEKIATSEIPEGEKISKIQKVSQSFNKYTRYTRTKVKTNMFIKHAMIGRGGFGAIYLVTDKSDGQFYALKVMPKSKIIENGLIANVAIEKKIYTKCHLKRSVETYATFQDKVNIYYLMEYLPGGDLRRLMTNIALSEKQVQFVIGEILLCLQELQAQNIYHLDLKPENIMLTSDGHFKLTDFGLSHIPNDDDFIKSLLDDASIQKRNKRYRRCATVGYMPPEVAQDREPTDRSDLWSVGVIMYELIYGKLPFPAEMLRTSDNNLMKHLVFPQFLIVSRNAINLMTALLQPASTRPPLSEIMKSKFFTRFNFEEPHLNLSPFVPAINHPFDLSHFNTDNLYDNDFAPQIDNSEWAKLAFLGFTYRKRPEPLSECQPNA